jgi:hypothetical protein
MSSPISNYNNSSGSFYTNSEGLPIDKQGRPGPQADKIEHYALEAKDCSDSLKQTGIKIGHFYLFTHFPTSAEKQQLNYQANDNLKFKEIMAVQNGSDLTRLFVLQPKE